MSLGISKVVQLVHDKYIAPAADVKTDEDLKQAEAKFAKDTMELHKANYHAVYQASRTEQASATLDTSTAAGAAADVLAQHEKQLQANERLKAGLLAKRNDLVMSILGRGQVAPKANYKASEAALKRIMPELHCAHHCSLSLVTIYRYNVCASSTQLALPTSSPCWQVGRSRGMIRMGG